MDGHCRRFKKYFNGPDTTRSFSKLIPHSLQLLRLVVVATALVLLMSCRRGGSPTSPTDPTVPTVPELTSTPYVDAGDVWISQGYMSFPPGIFHPGIDFATRKNIPILAAGAGVFNKQLYYHSGVPRWQVNAEILVGKNYAIDCLFEPGDSVTQAQATTQFDTLIATGTPVKAGDLLGTLYLAPGQDHAYLHLGIRSTITGQAECPMPFCSPELRAALLELYRRDHPGGQICYDHTY